MWLEFFNHLNKNLVMYIENISSVSHLRHQNLCQITNLKKPKSSNHHIVALEKFIHKYRTTLLKPYTMNKTLKSLIRWFYGGVLNIHPARWISIIRKCCYHLYQFGVVLDLGLKIHFPELFTLLINRASFINNASLQIRHQGERVQQSGTTSQVEYKINI